MVSRLRKRKGATSEAYEAAITTCDERRTLAVTYECSPRKPPGELADEEDNQRLGKTCHEYSGWHGQLPRMK